MQEELLKSGQLVIDLGALAANYQRLQQEVGNHCAVAGVIKANAYGLGLEEVARTLMQQQCPHFFVATLEEGIKLREITPDTPIAILNGLIPNATDIYLKKSLTAVLNSLQAIEDWQDIAKTQKRTLPAILHFDTGMNRLGLSADEAQALIENKERLDLLDVQWIMSHFACADEKGHELTEKQAAAFKEIAAHFPNAKKSLGNSPGVFRHVDYHIDMVRPGFALYGGNPTPEQDNLMHSVVSLHVPVLQTRLCKKGESIGYGASHVFDQDTRTATISLGYADGFHRTNSGRAVVYYRGKPCPVLGRVSMDLTTIDISQLPDIPPIGAPIEVLGPNQSVDDLANASETIGYEILTSLGARYDRIYTE